MIPRSTPILILVLICSLPVLGQVSVPDIQQMNARPLCFTENSGQWDGRVKFQANVGRATMWFTSDAAYYQFSRSKLSDWALLVSIFGSGDPDLPDCNGKLNRYDVESVLIEARFAGASLNPAVRGDELMEYKCNYFIGNDPDKWYTDVSNYRAVVYEDLYAGIDLKYYGNGEQMEYDFIVSPGADIAQIQVQYDGAKSLWVNESGELVVETEWGQVVECRPLVYQTVNGERVELQGEYYSIAENTFAFELLDEYNPTLAVVIDPVISYCTYLGSTGSDGYQYNIAHSVAIDGTGNAYVCGWTSSNAFPTTPGAYDVTGPSSYTDNFITKLSADGSSLVYSSYLGGWKLEDNQSRVAVDGSGNAYLCGRTASDDFPLVNAYDDFMDISNDIETFVTKFNADGNGLIYSTYLGGTTNDEKADIAVSPDGYAAVSGHTYSDDFPINNAYQTTKAYWQYTDAFVAKFAPDGSNVFATYLGGHDYDYGDAVAMDDAGNVYVGGRTNSTDFPMQNPYQGTKQSAYDGCVFKFSADGSSLIYSTYLGGGVGSTHDDWIEGIIVGKDTCAYVVGSTKSSNFPTVNPYQTDQYGDDAFVTKLSVDGSSLVYSTYLGGSGADYGYDITVDNQGQAAVTGYTASINFPEVDSLQENQATDDAFVTKFSVDGASLVFSTYFGGNGVDHGESIVTDPTGSDIYVAGYTVSTDLPTVNAYQSSFQGANDAFVVKIHSDVVPPYLTGDADGNDLINISDAVYLISYIFGGGPAPDTLAAGDANCDGIVNVSDAVYLIAYIFGGGPPPGDPDNDGTPDC